MTFEEARSRAREREGAGKSEYSWIKHGMLSKVVGAQVAAFRVRFPDSRAMLIDGNAGDGQGVDYIQPDLFNPQRTSCPTPQLLADLARRFGADLCLCERDAVKRRALVRQFPDALVVRDHQQVADAVRGYNYALWLSDPCGYSGHGVKHMTVVARHVLLSDFVVVFNEIALNRMLATTSPHWAKHRALYGDMDEPQWWLAQLSKRVMARTPLTRQSSNFQFRLFVLANALADGVRRLRGAEIINRGGHHA